MTQSQNIHYASLRMRHSTAVMNTRYYCFEDQFGRQAVVTAGPQFDQLLRTIKIAQQQQEAQYATQ